MTPEQLETLSELASEKSYGRGPNHAKQVSKLSLKIYHDLVKLDMLEDTGGDKRILEAAALLHDTGLPEKPHNVATFKMLLDKIPQRLGTQALSKGDFSTLLYCVLFHRGHDFSERNELQMVEPVRTRCLAAVLRIADGLDYGPPFDAPIEDVAPKKAPDGTMVCSVQPSSGKVKARVEYYVGHVKKDKMDLFQDAFGQDMVFEVLDA